MTWYLTPLDGGNLRQLDIDADSNLAIGGGSVRILDVTVSPEYEGAYSCRTDIAPDQDIDAGCLLVLGESGC